MKEKQETRSVKNFAKNNMKMLGLAVVVIAAVLGTVAIINANSPLPKYKFFADAQNNRRVYLQVNNDKTVQDVYVVDHGNLTVYDTTDRGATLKLADVQGKSDSDIIAKSSANDKTNVLASLAYYKNHFKNETLNNDYRKSHNQTELTSDQMTAQLDAYNKNVSMIDGYQYRDPAAQSLVVSGKQNGKTLTNELFGYFPNNNYPVFYTVDGNNKVVLNLAQSAFVNIARIVEADGKTNPQLDDASTNGITLLK